MKIISINPSPEQASSAVGKLQDDLYAVLRQFMKDHPEMPAAVMVGVLEFLKHNVIERSEEL